MINEGVDYIRREVRNYLQINDADVITDNVHVLKGENGAPEGVYLSVVNVREETALKNGDHYVRENNQLRHKEPPVHLNVYLLFAVAFSDYGQSLLRLSQVVELFQSKRVFTAENEAPANPFPQSLEKLIFDFTSLNFEELNHLWGVLGGAYFPSVLYRVRLIKVQRNVSEAAPEVTAIGLGTSVL
jgi:uncharacterized protein DUF4255